MDEFETRPSSLASDGANGAGLRQNGPTAAGFDLARLLQPVSLETFISDYWEKRPLVVRRSDRSTYEPLLSLSDVDHILHHSSVRPSDFRLVRDGQDIPHSALSGEGANRTAGSLEALYQEYRAGATIVLLFLHERWPPLKRLCQSIAAELSAGVQVNVYLTPVGERALPTHYDTHDVFVLQTYGSKHWRIYHSPFQLPLPEHPYRAADGLDPGQPQEEFTLETGDLIYIPRGFLHDAASRDDTSLHLTIGIKPITWASILSDAVQSAIDRDPRLRQSLPPGFASDDEAAKQCEAMFGKLLPSVFAEVDPTVMIDEARTRALFASYPSLDGHLLDLEAERRLNDDTVLRRRADVQTRLASDDEFVYLHFHGKVVQMPVHVEPDLRYVVEHEQFTASELPGTLDAEGRDVLVRQLVKEGFATID
jgi:ribosomal protein L16 Arg81 hydroxylase